MMYDREALALLDSLPKIRVRDLTASERDEYICIIAEVDRLNNVLKHYTNDRAMIETRSTLFYGKIRKEKQMHDAEAITIDLNQNAVMKVMHYTEGK